MLWENSILIGCIVYLKLCIIVDSIMRGICWYTITMCAFDPVSLPATTPNTPNTPNTSMYCTNLKIFLHSYRSIKMLCYCPTCTLINLLSVVRVGNATSTSWSNSSILSSSPPYIEDHSVVAKVGTDGREGVNTVFTAWVFISVSWDVYINNYIYWVHRTV